MNVDTAWARWWGRFTFLQQAMYEISGHKRTLNSGFYGGYSEAKADYEHDATDPEMVVFGLKSVEVADLVAGLTVLDGAGHLTDRQRVLYEQMLELLHT